MRSALSAIALALAIFPTAAFGACGDPQVKTDHPWYPGELSCSTFERLFKTQAEVYKRVTGRSVDTDEDKALAAWFWRNFNFAHAEDGKSDYWDVGWKGGGDSKNREYWHGLFALGIGLCGTTHAHMCAEMNALLGQGRGRVVGVSGHNTFEAYLTGGEYGEGKWALLDHDISTVIFDPEGKRLLSVKEIKADIKNLADPSYKKERQRGWLISGLHPSDARGVYTEVKWVEYLAGYACPPPMVHLRAGESLRRYLKPGLEDGKTFVYWGRNYKGKIPGPSRGRTWVNQPEKMFGADKATPDKEGQVRYANAVYTYKPDFASGKYKEGVIDEGDDHVTFEFYTPYVIGCTPPNDSPWGIYDQGAKNGLVLNGKMTCGVKISTDQGETWQDAGKTSDGMDLTDFVKGRKQYWIRFDAPAKELAGTDLAMRTACHCNVAVIPRLKDGANKVTFHASGLGVISAGPNKGQAEAHLVEGKMGDKQITLELAAPRNEKAVRVYAAAWVASGCPPKSEVKYQIEYSTDGGKSWKSVVKDWQVVRRPYEPDDFWSQSFCWGEAALDDVQGPVRVRFSNDGNIAYRKVEAHLAYKVSNQGPVEVTFAWTEGGGGEAKKASRVFPGKPGEEDSSWIIETGQKAETVWVEYAAK